MAAGESVPLPPQCGTLIIDDLGRPPWMRCSIVGMLMGKDGC